MAQRTARFSTYAHHDDKELLLERAKCLVKLLSFPTTPPDFVANEIGLLVGAAEKYCGKDRLKESLRAICACEHSATEVPAGDFRSEISPA